MSTIKTNNLQHTGSADVNLALDSSGYVAIQDGAVGTPALYFSGDSNTGIYSPGADSVAISTGGTARATVDSSGRLLVGTSTSTSVSFYTAKTQIANAENANLSLHGYSTYTQYGADIIFTRSRSGSIGTNTIVQNGDQLARLFFAGANGTGYDIAAFIGADVDGVPGASGDMPGRLVFSTTADGASSPTERMRIRSDGRIGVNSPDYTHGRFIVESDCSAITTAVFRDSLGGTGSSNLVGFIRNGTIVGTISTTNTATAYNTSSDYRLKENVAAVTDGITRLQQLKPSRFNFIADPDKTVDGFIAHEVQVVVPEAISGEKDAVDDDGNPIYQGIDQSKLVPLLTAALQEAIGEIKSLKARVAALESA